MGCVCSKGKEDELAVALGLDVLYADYTEGDAVKVTVNTLQGVSETFTMCPTVGRTQ
jgi:hypothetical protein